MQFPYDTASSLLFILSFSGEFPLYKLRSVCPLIGALPQPQQPNEDILLRILIGQESLPPSVGCVVSAKEFHG
jgi:hypothetical protein